MYYKTLRRSDLKRPRILCIFICADTKIQIITNHPRLSVLIYFICRDTNKQIISNYLRISITENIIRKAFLMLLCSIYSLIQPYIRRYTRTHSYIKPCQETLPYDFHYNLYICLSSAIKHIFSHHSQKLLTFMKT